MEAWGLTDPGMVREQNQDSYDIVQMDDGALLCIVCDGMGGAKSGNVASRLACEVFVNEIQRIYRHGSGEEAVRQALLAAASLANTTVFEQSKLGPDFDGMGTTLVAAMVWPEYTLVANIGDSRAYHLNPEGIHRITTDHSVVEDMVRRGDMMSMEDVTDILGIPILGAIPDDEEIVISTNQGEPLVGMNSFAGQAYLNICKRILGQEVPLMGLEKNKGFFHMFSGLLKRA